jgi:hypothetical protein
MGRGPGRGTARSLAPSVGRHLGDGLEVEVHFHRPGTPKISVTAGTGRRASPPRWRRRPKPWRRS